VPGCESKGPPCAPDLLCKMPTNRCDFEIEWEWKPPKQAKVCVFHRPKTAPEGAKSECESDMERAPKSFIAFTIGGRSCIITDANFDLDGNFQPQTLSPACKFLIFTQKFIELDPPGGGQRMFGDRKGQCLGTPQLTGGVEALKFDINQEWRCICTATG